MGIEKKANGAKLHEIASFVHGSLFALHSLGVYYNLRKKRYMDAGLHGAFLIYDFVASYKHYKNRDND